jgi:Ricin-type beta-trefoil lectin domain-like
MDAMNQRLQRYGPTLLIIFTLFAARPCPAQQAAQTYWVLSNNRSARVELQKDGKCALIDADGRREIAAIAADGTFTAWGTKGKVLLDGWDTFNGRLLTGGDIIWPGDAWVKKKPTEPFRVIMQNRAGNGFLEIPPGLILVEGGHAAQFGEVKQALNQQWWLIEVEGNPGTYVIKNVASDKYLTWDKPRTDENGAPVFQYGFTGEYNQHFKFVRLSDEFIEIRCKAKEKCLEVEAGKISEPYAGIKYADHNDKPNQHWRMRSIR